MEGWRLNRGRITQHQLSQQEMWGHINRMVSNRSKNQASYKFGFIRVLLENLYNADRDLVIGFGPIFQSFTRLYWNLVVTHGLSQTDKSHPHSAIEKALRGISAEHAIPAEMYFDRLPGSIQDLAFKKAKEVAKRYVVGAIYGDTEGTIYEFSLRSEYVKFNPCFFQFMQEHQPVVVKLNNYELLKFLLANNPSALHQNLINNVEYVTARSSLETYCQVLLKHTENHCFYCGVPFRPRRTRPSVDHFIPWTMVRNDHLWNLVLCCRPCNNSKRDRVPSSEYLQALVSRNERLAHVTDELVFREMELYWPEKVERLHQYALQNGYATNWRPSRR